MEAERKRIASIFIDESGAKNSAGGSFVVGMLKTYQPARLWRTVRDIRQKHGYFQEIKFTDITANNLRFYFDIVEEIANSKYVARIGASVYNADTGFTKGSDTWVEQARMARRLIVGNTNRTDYVIAFLDLVQTPRNETAAARVKDETNNKLDGAPLIEAYDIDSKAHDLVQLADIIASSIHWIRTHNLTDVKKTNPKYKVAKRFQRALELDSFNDTKEGKVNILTMSGDDGYIPGLDIDSLTRGVRCDSEA